jgi:hypothetical protein
MMFGLNKRKLEYNPSTDKFEESPSRKERENKIFKEEYKKSYEGEREAHIKRNARLKAKRAATMPALSETFLSHSFGESKGKGRGKKRRQRSSLFEGGSIFG